jgi:hypothetical protein
MALILLKWRKQRSFNLVVSQCCYSNDRHSPTKSSVEQVEIGAKYLVAGALRA